MKKYLILAISIFSIFLISDRVEALSFTATNGNEYTVDSEEKLLDYCYYTYYKNNNYTHFGIVKSTNSSYPYVCYFGNDYGRNFNFWVDSKVLFYQTTALTYMFYTFKADFSSSFSTYSIFQNLNSIIYSSSNIYTDNTFSNVYFSSNFTINDIENRYSEISKYIITYYINNEIYKEIEVEEGSSHQLENYEYDSSLYNFSGFVVEGDKDLNNITSDIIIRATLKPKDIYTVTYYINDEVYKVVDVIEGSSHQLEEYSYNSDLYNFSGWTIENELDITNITNDIVIRGTLEQKAITPVYIKNFDDFPITKTEFYTLLVLLGILILMLFLRWCFPMKGGKNL